MSHSFRARTLVLGAAILLTLAGTGCDEIPEADPSADPATTVTTEAATETADTPDATSGTTQAPGTALSPNAPLPSSSDSSTASGPLAAARRPGRNGARRCPPRYSRPRNRPPPHPAPR